MMHRPHPIDPQRAAAGGWQLAPGRALTLQARRAGVLRLHQGAVWATLTGPHAGAGPRPGGDLHLVAGQQLSLAAGQRLVLEPVHARPGQMRELGPAAFDWRPQSAPAASGWRGEVVQPAAELAQALHAAGWALLRLARGLLGWLWHTLRPSRYEFKS